MTIENIKHAIENILNRIDVVKGKGEEATKQAMVLPMLEALGYDIWNPTEVCPEYEADTAVKKNGQKEKVDFAILFNNIPKIFVEVKTIDENLMGHHGQLKRYFSSTPSVSLAVLTNGIEYRFFTDTGEINIQDDEPFFVANLTGVDQGLNVIAKFQKDMFSGEAIREYATELTYTEKMTVLLKAELDVRDAELSESFTRWVLEQPNMYEGKRTAGVVERFKPIAKDALQKVIRDIVRRSVAAIDDGVTSPSNEKLVDNTSDENLSENVNQEPNNTLNQIDLIKTDIVTTEEELDSFAIIKRQFENSVLCNALIYNPTLKRECLIEISYRNTTSYFNKPSWWNFRLSLKSKIKWVGIDIDPDKGRELVPSNFEILKPQSSAMFRVRINEVEDLNALSQVILGAFEKTIQDRENCRVEEEKMKLAS